MHEEFSIPTCATCPFWMKYPEKPGDTFRLGDCRRHAPTMIAVRAEDPRDSADFTSPFPYTESGDWCGEHPAREPAR